jgi:hypothetical protein
MRRLPSAPFNASATAECRFSLMKRAVTVRYPANPEALCNKSVSMGIHPLPAKREKLDLGSTGGGSATGFQHSSGGERLLRIGGEGAHVVHDSTTPNGWIGDHPRSQSTGQRMHVLPHSRPRPL